jgi:hypothetical protein
MSSKDRRCLPVSFAPLVPLALAMALSACSGQDAIEQDPLALEGSPGLITAGRGDVGTLSDNSTYYAVRRDARQCAGPSCGGWWIRRLNLATTRCADDGHAPECYVADIDAVALGFSPKQIPWGENQDRVIIRGTVQSASYGEYGQLGQLVATEAWTAGIPDHLAEGPVYRVRSVLGCGQPIGACPAHRSGKLNSALQHDLAVLTLSGTGATTQTLARAAQALEEESGLLVAGHHSLVQGGPRAGQVLTATQFYTRIKPVLPTRPISGGVGGGLR